MHIKIDILRNNNPKMFLKKYSTATNPLYYTTLPLTSLVHASTTFFIFCAL